MSHLNKAKLIDLFACPEVAVKSVDELTMDQSGTSDSWFANVISVAICRLRTNFTYITNDLVRLTVVLTPNSLTYNLFLPRMRAAAVLASAFHYLILVCTMCFRRDRQPVSLPDGANLANLTLAQA
jgi:hypothetical protein